MERCQQTTTWSMDQSKKFTVQPISLISKAMRQRTEESVCPLCCHEAPPIADPVKWPYALYPKSYFLVRDGAVMRHFIEGEAEPGRWELHGWQAGAARHHAAALERSRQAAAHFAATVTLHPEAVGALPLPPPPTSFSTPSIVLVMSLPTQLKNE